MTQIGEGIAIALIRLEEDKCVFCGKKHKNRKKDEIKPTGWKRKAIKGVGGNFVAKKKALYPNNTSPPSYRSEGHHCLAFSAFIVDARNSPKDRFAALNHYIKEKDYNPNNDNNVIDLPGRKKKGQGKEANFYAYEEAVLAGKPLQLHIGGHAKEFLMQSNIMLRDIVNDIVDFDICKQVDDKFKKKLKDKVVKAEDKAFKLTASVQSPWIAHPNPMREAENYVKKKHSISEIKYPKI